MKAPSLRAIAREIGISASTLSRALRGHHQVNPETAKIAIEALQKAGYHPDPIISAGLSKVRQGNAYRETVAVCFDKPNWWVPEMTASFDEYGASLGYCVEVFMVDPADEVAINKLCKQWRARGIRGVILSTFQGYYPHLPFIWENFAWVTIGQKLSHLPFHHIGRDYEAELLEALDYLKSRGCERPAFLAHKDSVLGEAFLRTALRFYHKSHAGLRQPFLEVNSMTPAKVKHWLRYNQADSFLADGGIQEWLERDLANGGQPKAVFFAHCTPSCWKDTIFYEARFDIMAQSAINVLHGLLTHRVFGVPGFRQRVSVSATRHALESGGGINEELVSRVPS